MWFTREFVDIVRDEMKLPLNDEMIKQAKVHEGDIQFLYDMWFVCQSTEQVELTDKQKNFMIRLMLQTYKVRKIEGFEFLYALKASCFRALALNVPTKEIEKKIMEIVNQRLEEYGRT